LGLDHKAMTAEVVDINANRPHLSGKAKCLECHHEWVNVAPAGLHHFECPKCGLLKGVYHAVVMPDELFQCHCGCASYFIGRYGCMCALCGELATF
jgi:hypothetical protein